MTKADSPNSNLKKSSVREDALLFRKISIPETYLVTRRGHRFGGDLRVGDLDGDGSCDFLIYRCDHGAPECDGQPEDRGGPQAAKKTDIDITLGKRGKGKLPLALVSIIAHERRVQFYLIDIVDP